MYDYTLAPCGIDCSLCYAFQRERGKCPGCRSDRTDKPTRCLRCGINNCVSDKGLSFCYECPDFPCARLRSLDRRYVKKYSVSVIENLKLIRLEGAASFARKQKIIWTCAGCGTLTSMHTPQCPGCGTMR